MSHPPEWVSAFAERVAQHLVAVDVLSPVGCHVAQVDDVWEITVFASQTEILGGPLDGAQRPSRFHLDLGPLPELFDTVESTYWQAQTFGDEDDIGPHVGIEGTSQGRRIWLRIPSQAPEGFPPGRRARVHQNAWEDLW